MELNNRSAPPWLRPRPRARRRSEFGLTLTELLVSIIILAVIGGSIAGAFSIGLRVLGNGQSQARLAGSHGILSFEQQLGGDIARAVCLSAPTQPSLPSGGCAGSTQKSPTTCGAGYVLCLAYVVPGSTPATCHTVTYSRLSDNSLARTDSTSAGVGRFTTVAFTVTPVVFSTTTLNGYTWVSQVKVTITQVATPGAPIAQPAAATFQAAPLVADPASPVSGGTTPC